MDGMEDNYEMLRFEQANMSGDWIFDVFSYFY